MSKLRQKRILFGFVVLAFIVALGGCGLGASRAVEQIDESFALGSGEAIPLPMPTMMPAEPQAAALGRDKAVDGLENVAGEEAPAGLDGAPRSEPAAISVPRYDRKIIKSAEITLQVEDTDVAVDLLTGIVTDYDGYVVSSRTWSEGDYRMATVTLSVPVDVFEQVLRRLRGMALEVLNERAEGQDVTEQFVDLESRLRNLEATQTRIRTFLDQAVTVEEALEVNYQLSQIEGQIEEVKGKMNYLKERAAYSSIAVQLQPVRPTPTPSPTPTLPAWRPVETFQEAGGALTVILRFFGDLAIWLAVIVLPFLVPLAVIIWLLITWSRRRAKRADKNQEQE